MKVHSGCYQIWRIPNSNFGPPEISVQICRSHWDQLCRRLYEQQTPLPRTLRDFVRYSHGIGSYLTPCYFVTLYSSLCQSQDLQHQNMAYRIYVSYYLKILSIWPQMLVEHNQKSTWIQPFRTVRIEGQNMIQPGIEDTCICLDPGNLAQSEWDTKFGNIECQFSLYHEMT